MTNRGEGSISVVSFATRHVVKKWHIPGGGSPDMGNVSADGKILWLTGRYNGVVYAISTERPAAREDPRRRRAARACVWPQPGTLFARAHGHLALRALRATPTPRGALLHATLEGRGRAVRLRHDACDGMQVRAEAAAGSRRRRSSRQPCADPAALLRIREHERGAASIGGRAHERVDVGVAADDAVHDDDVVRLEAPASTMSATRRSTRFATPRSAASSRPPPRSRPRARRSLRAPRRRRAARARSRRCRRRCRVRSRRARRRRVRRAPRGSAQSALAELRTSRAADFRLKSLR